MRISTSPMPIHGKIVQRVNQMPQNIRSNSLSNSSIFSSKFNIPMENSCYLPNYNSNSVVRVIPHQQIKFQQKIVSNPYGNVENSHLMEENIKKIIQRLQTVQKKLKKQEGQIKTVQKQTDQKLLLFNFSQKFIKQIQQKNAFKQEQLFQQIRKLQKEIFHKIEILSKNLVIQIQKVKSEQQHESMNKQIQNGQNSLNNKKSIKMIEERVKQEIFKLQIYLQNQINKALFSLKSSSEVNLIQIMNKKSNLKYKYRPLQISIKNEVSVSKGETLVTKNQTNLVKNPLQFPSKRKKQTLSTTNSSGSSEYSENQNNNKTIQIQEQIYFIDKQGYLLDQNGYYILNQQQKMIRIDRSLIKKLREFRMIQ